MTAACWLHVREPGPEHLRELLGGVEGGAQLRAALFGRLGVVPQPGPALAGGQWLAGGMVGVQEPLEETPVGQHEVLVDPP
jgi:hypothetical protein